MKALCLLQQIKAEILVHWQKEMINHTTEVMQ